MTPADQEARQRLRTELDATFFVEAGAGTGKTKELVERIAALVASGVAMDRLAAITFTDAAAAELRDRVRVRLEEAGDDRSQTEEERERCARGALEIDLAAIQTIHSFAGGLLRRFPLEAGLPPGFAVWNELERDIAFKERLRRWLYEEVPGHAGRERAVQMALALGLSPAHLATLAARLQEHYDLLTPSASWQAGVLSDAVQAAHEIGSELLSLPPLLPLAHDPDRDPLAADVRAVQPIARRLVETGASDDALIALKRFRDLNVTGWRGRQERWNEDRLGNPAPRIKASLKNANDRANQVLMAHRSRILGDLLGHLRDFTLAFAAERRAQGVATFHDLLVWARDLLRDQPQLRCRAHDLFERILIDEFQDTDPLQVEIAWFLAADPAQAQENDWRRLRPRLGRLFVVGDPKQSIYRFRRADIGIYEDVRLALGDGGEVVALTQNFRSVKPILEWVNHHLGREMRPSPDVQPAYRELHPRPEGAVSGGGAYRLGGLVDGKAGERWLAEARAVARLARQIVDEGWLVSRGGGSRWEQAHYQDICVLLPARTNLHRLERAFELEDVPYRMESGSLVLNTSEVRDLLSCLRAIEDPSDQVALVAALRSPAYACSDVDLLAWTEAGGRFDYEHPFGEPSTPGAARVQAALANLLAFHQARHTRSSAATIEAFVRDRMLAVQAFGQPRPREAWRRLRYVVAQARRLAASGQPSLRSVLDWLEGLQHERFYDAESAIPEGDEDAVRFMTVHGSKGLEFPIVILTGLGAVRRRPAGPHIATDRRAKRLEVYVNGWFSSAGFDQPREDELDRAEQVRLLYVATTRARDHLVLSLFHTARETDSQAGRMLQGLSEAPHLCQAVRLADSASAPARLPKLIPEPVSPDAHRLREEAWLASRQGLIDSLARERRYTPTSLSRLPVPELETEELELTSDEGPETPRWFPRGRAATARGLAVHAVLQAIDLRTVEGLDVLAAAVAAGYGIREQAERVASLAGAAAQSGPVRAAIASGRFHREVPVGISWRGALLEGYIDLLYEREDGSLTVIDYKTDHITASEIGDRMGHYRLQGGAYAMALERATQRTVSSVEFVFAALGQSVALERPAIVQLTGEVARLLAS